MEGQVKSPKRPSYVNTLQGFNVLYTIYRASKGIKCMGTDVRIAVYKSCETGEYDIFAKKKKKRKPQKRKIEM